MPVPGADSTPGGPSGIENFPWLAQNPVARAMVNQGMSPGDLASQIPFSRFNQAPVGGDNYRPGQIAGTSFPTWNITPGNRVIDPGNQIPFSWIPPRGAAPDETTIQGTRDTNGVFGNTPGFGNPLGGFGGIPTHGTFAGDTGAVAGGGPLAGLSLVGAGIGGPATAGQGAVAMRRGGRSNLHHLMNQARLRTLMRMRRRMQRRWGGGVW